MVLVGEREVAELAIDPASSGFHEAIRAFELIKHKILKKGLNAELQFITLSYLLIENSNAVKDCFFHSEVSRVA